MKSTHEKTNNNKIARSNEYCVNKFMALLNVYRYSNDYFAYEDISKYFHVSLDESDLDEINKIVSLIYILSEND